MVTLGPQRKLGDMMRGAIFDWDGTLASIDDREFYCINHALAEQGVKSISREFYTDNYYRRAYELGTGPRMVIETALGRKGRTIAEKAYESYRKIFQSSPDKATLQPGALEILRNLRGERFKIGIATMRYTRWVVEAELKHLGVASHVDILMTRQDLGVRGTLGSLEETVDQRVQLVTREMEKLGLGANDVFLVGDSWWDIKAGKKIGIRTVLVKTGFAAYNDFIEERPDMIVGSLFELQQLLVGNYWKP
ncbi:MAG TPA: HAD family hydrolase [Candidatus Dormibacteraeota bacterium]|nr:HAD family hydrolase [Candidatus Dormibacteraeota bacterium]